MEQNSNGSLPEPPPPSSSVPPPPPPLPGSNGALGRSKGFGNLRVSKATGLLIALLLGSGVYYLGFVLPERRAMERERQLAEQRKAEESARPLKELEARIVDWRDHGTLLPPCPLIYPLVDGSKKVTPLGSFLSYMAMRQATYLPQSVFELSDVEKHFHSFHLFDPKPTPFLKGYRKYLNTLFDTKDFGEGQFVKAGKGYRVSLKFWGSHPGKKYSKTFPAHGMHLVPAWMAGCLHDWTALSLTPDQKTFRDADIFKNDDDLKRAASLERIFLTSPRLVLRWEDVLKSNPESPFLLNRYALILEDRLKKGQSALLEPLVNTHPLDTELHLQYAKQVENGGSCDLALKLVFDALKRDARNREIIEQAGGLLRKKDWWEQAIHFREAFTRKFPDDQLGWVQLSQEWTAWGWHIRGTDYDENIPEDQWNRYRRTVEKGMPYDMTIYKQGTNDCRVWASLQNANDVTDRQTTIDGNYCFDQAIALNPYFDQAVRQVSETQVPNFGADPKVEYAFLHKWEWLFPEFVFDAITKEFWAYNDYAIEKQSVEGRRKYCEDTRKNIINSYHWPFCRQAYMDHLSRVPADLEAWKGFAFWSDWVDEREQVLFYAKKVTAGDPELRAVYPNVVMMGIDMEMQNKVTHDEAGAVENRPEVQERRHSALRELVSADDQNWCWQNQYARFCSDHGFMEEAKRSFGAIGDRWDAEVWSKREFEVAKSKTYGLPTPTPVTIKVPVSKK